MLDSTGLTDILSNQSSVTKAADNYHHTVKPEWQHAYFLSYKISSNDDAKK